VSREVVAYLAGVVTVLFPVGVGVFLAWLDRPRHGQPTPVERFREADRG
jgi:hypothetical protein